MGVICAEDLHIAISVRSLVRSDPERNLRREFPCEGERTVFLSGFLPTALRDCSLNLL